MTHAKEVVTTRLEQGVTHAIEVVTMQERYWNKGVTHYRSHDQERDWNKGWHTIAVVTRKETEQGGDSRYRSRDQERDWNKGWLTL